MEIIDTVQKFENLSLIVDEFESLNLTVEEFESGLYLSGFFPTKLHIDKTIKWRPFGNFTEKLEFKTDVLTKRDGGEQRYSTRSVPRQSFTSSHVLNQGEDLALFENFVSKHRDDKILFPIWSEPMIARSGAGYNNPTINVDTTNYSDIRSGGYIGVVTGNLISEVAIVSAFDENSIFINSGLSKSYFGKTEIVPVKEAYIDRCNGQRFKTCIETKDLSVSVADFLPRFADASGYFNNFSGKLLVDDLNFIKGKSMDSQFVDDIIRIDGGDGDFRLDSIWDLNKKEKTKGFITTSRNEVWNTKGLFYYLDGRRKSFYMPSYNEDLVLSSGISSSSTELSIKYIGYSTYITEPQSPYNHLILTKRNGEKIIKNITGAIYEFGSSESLFVDSSWGENIDIDDVFSAQILEKTRLNSDNITIRHKNALGYSEVFVKTINVK
jgi:hypothetical protein